MPMFAAISLSVHPSRAHPSSLSNPSWVSHSWYLLIPFWGHLLNTTITP
nr:MAG TPA: hypothetical protein [Caudoviricetes sp.]DAU78110.1 MAG TPA: hypothetical protein [Caudoviricetes sp.]